MPVVRTPQTSDYTQIPNSILRDPNLNPQDKGVLCYMLSMPPDWRFSYKTLGASLGIGETSLKSSVGNLQRVGYLHISKEKVGGKYASAVWNVSDTPYVQNPHTEKPHVEKPYVQKPHVEKPRVEKPRVENVHSNKDFIDKDFIDQNCPTQSMGWDCRAGFDLFWDQYPKKISMKEASAEWEKVCSDQTTQDQILEGLKRWKNSLQWEKENGRFIPNPAKWLLDQRWREHPKEKIPQGASGELGQAELEAIQKLLCCDTTELFKHEP